MTALSDKTRLDPCALHGTNKFFVMFRVILTEHFFHLPTKNFMLNPPPQKTP